MDEDTYRSVMAQWPSGVVVVTTGSARHWHGMTASAFTGVSLSPPMVLVCLTRGTRTHDLVSANGCFAVSVLGKDQAPLGRVFAGQEHAADRFAGARWTPGPTGSPVLADSIGWLDCRVAHRYPGGDHTIFVGEVLAAATPRRVAPVLFHSRSWSQLADPLPGRVTVADTGLLTALRAQGVDPVRLAATAHAMRAAGTRVRLPFGGPGFGGLEGLDPATASVFVHEAGQVRRAAAVGAGVVEFAADDAGAIIEEAHRAGLATVAHLPGAFVPHRAEHLLGAVSRLARDGCDEIGLSEAAGPAATPLHLRTVLQDAAVAAGTAALRVGLRHGDGMGLVNALIALKSGVSHFDTTLGGVDGALPAEDLLLLTGQLDVACAVDRDALLAVKEKGQQWLTD